jgi:hypothetical protein
MKVVRLNFSDFVDPSFLTESNAANFVNGINQSGNTVPISVPNGGLGNNAFAEGQTLMFDGVRIVSSGALPQINTALVNDDRYYTKAQIDAMFASLSQVNGPITVDYSNVDNAPAPGVKIGWLTSPVVVFTGTTVMAGEIAQSFVVPGISTLVGIIVTCTATIDAPSGGQVATMRCRANDAAQWIDIGWFMAAGSGDYVAGCDQAIVPLNTDGTFRYYLTCGSMAAGATCVDPGPLTLTIVGYLYS